MWFLLPAVRRFVIGGAFGSYPALVAMVMARYPFTSTQKRYFIKVAGTYMCKHLSVCVGGCDICTWLL